MLTSSALIFFLFVDDDDENFRRRTEIGGNSIPNNGFVDDCSLLLLSFWVDIDQRSCIFFSRRDILSLSSMIICSLFASIEFSSLVNPIQMSWFDRNEDWALSLNIVVFDSLMTFDVDPSIQIESINVRFFSLSLSILRLLE